MQVAFLKSFEVISFLDCYVDEEKIEKYILMNCLTQL